MKHGMKTIRDNPWQNATSSARRRCPTCGGLKVPPKIPIFTMPAFSNKGLVFAGKDSIFNPNNLKEELSQKVVDDFYSSAGGSLV